MNSIRLADLLGLPRPKKRSRDHPILRLEALFGELNEDDAEDAGKVFGLVRSSLERDRPVNRFVDFLASQAAYRWKRACLFDDMAQVEQEMRLFQKANGDPEVIKIEG